ncbi:uroplakin-2-like [Leucoraja erinacea]|uniref:uroplakin-2-like n=1 Tax=Leucoraja erinaceus TaxID=7782 RepID=UPI002455E127|nr:uroplakin-2-like [Leucoraja erinacea]
MGPRMACRNGSCIENVLPGQAFRIRYTLQDVSGNPLIMTQWSDSISTKDEPASYVSIQAWDAGLRSGSMVVITVLLAVAVFTLIVGFAAAVTMGWR